MNALFKQVRVTSGANALLAAWLVVSLWVLSDDPLASLWPVLVVAVVIGICATMRVLWPNEGTSLSWANALLGLWIAISPWAIGYFDNESLLLNSSAVGAAIVTLAVWSSATTTILRAMSRSRLQDW